MWLVSLVIKLDLMSSKVTSPKSKHSGEKKHKDSGEKKHKDSGEKKHKDSGEKKHKDSGEKKHKDSGEKKHKDNNQRNEDGERKETKKRTRENINPTSLSLLDQLVTAPIVIKEEPCAESFSVNYKANHHKEDAMSIVPYVETRVPQFNGDKVLDTMNSLFLQLSNEKNHSMELSNALAIAQERASNAASNRSYEHTQLQVRYEHLQNVTLTEKDAKISQLEAQCKEMKRKYREAKDQLAKRTHPTTNQHLLTAVTNNVTTIHEAAVDANAPLQMGDDTLNHENIPFFAYALQEEHFSSAVTALIHCRAEIPQLNFGVNTNVVVVPFTGVYKLYDLMPFLRGNTFFPFSDTREFIDIAQVGIYLKANSFVIAPVTQPDGTTQVSNGLVFNENAAAASRFNYKNILQTLIMQEIVYQLFVVDGVGNPDEEASKPKKKKAKAGHEDAKNTEEKEKIRRLYDSGFQTRPKLTNIQSRIAHPELMPFTPAHLSTFFGLPVKPDLPGGKKSQGGWKECFCGAHCTFSQNKTSLVNHITKCCPFSLLSCASCQMELVRGAKFTSFTATVENAVDSMNRQIAIFDETYKSIQPFIAQKYADFFSKTQTEAPPTFSSTLIYANGEPYNQAELDRAMNQMVNAGRHAVYNYSRNATGYRSAIASDNRIASFIVASNDRPNAVSRPVLIADVYQNLLVSAAQLQAQDLLTICYHESDIVLDTKTSSPIGANQSLPVRQQPQQAYQDKQMDVTADDESLVHGYFELERLQQDANALRSQIEHTMRENEDADISVFSTQLAELNSQITTKDCELKRLGAISQNKQNQRKQVSMSELVTNPCVPLFAPQQQQQQLPVPLTHQQQQQMLSTPIDFSMFTPFFTPTVPTTPTTATTTTTAAATTATLPNNMFTMSFLPPMSNQMNMMPLPFNTTVLPTQAINDALQKWDESDEDFAARTQSLAQKTTH